MSDFYIELPPVGSGGAPSGPAGGDLSGTYPNPTVTGVSFTIPVAKGGTGSTTAAAANVALTPASVAVSALDVNWSLGNQFYKSISTSSTFTFSNVQDGATISLAVTTSGASQTVTLPAGIKFANAAQPTQTAPGTDIYTFSRLNGTTYCVVAQNFA